MNITINILIGIWALLGFESCKGDASSQYSVNERNNRDPVETEMIETIQQSTNSVEDALTDTSLTETGSASWFYNTVTGALKGNKRDHEEPEDYTWNNAEAVTVELEGNSVTVNESGAEVSNTTLTITAPGTYVLSGRLNDGQVIVNSQRKGVVRLVLNGVNISCSSSAPVYIVKSSKTIIILADNSQNTLTDGSNYIFEDPAIGEPNAVIFSKSDLTIYGKGSLTVLGNFKDGIDSNDGLILSKSQINITAKDNGIEGRDYLIIKEGNISVNAGGDGLKSNHDQDTAAGYVYIKSGTIDITTVGDAIQAKTDVLISTGNITLHTTGITSGNNNGNVAISSKTVNASVNAIIDGGTFAIESADDGLHSNGNLVINGGNIHISCNDDAIHADSTITINRGTIDIVKSYEGIESQIITINNGNIHLVSSDDGLNAVTGNNNFRMEGGPGGGPRGRPGGNYGDARSRGRGRNFGGYGGSGNNMLYINGGRIVVDAYGDGIDINGSVVMTGGQLIVNGPIANFNSALDYNGSFTISGGFVVAAGSSRMAQAPAGNSSQNSLLLNFNTTQQAGTPFHIQSSSGKEILSFIPAKRYQSVAFSSPELIYGESYDIFLGGTFSGNASDGLYSGAKYIPGTKYTSFTVSNNITSVYRR